MDAKGRLSIPTGFRAELQRQSKCAPILTNLRDCLALFPFEDWERLEQQLCSGSQLQPEFQALQRFLISGAVECPIDSQGRILVPLQLREYAELNRDVTLAGVGPRIEIWDKARFDQDLNATKSHYNEISKVISQIGL